MTLDEALEVLDKKQSVRKTNGKKFSDSCLTKVPIGIGKLDNGEYCFMLSQYYKVSIEFCEVATNTSGKPLPPLPVKKGRERIQSFTLEEIFSHFPPDPFVKRVEVSGRMLKLVSDRLYTFWSKGVVCVECGVSGSIFWYEDLGNGQPHLNLYAQVGEELRLMTKDHIIPKSKGGKDRLDNYQTMCSHCNELKGNAIPEGIST